jgi:hypothetical protein
VRAFGEATMDDDGGLIGTLCYFIVVAMLFVVLGLVIRLGFWLLF